MLREVRDAPPAEVPSSSAAGSCRRRTARGPVVAVVPLGLLLCAGALAHPFHKVGQETYLAVRGGKLVVDYYTSYGPVQAGVHALRADPDGDSELTREEVDAFLERHAAGLLAGLKVTVDGEPIELRYARGEISRPPQKYLFEISGTLVVYEALLSDLPAGRHVLRLVEGNFPGIAREDLKYFVRAGPPTHGLRLSEDRRTLEWAFEYTADLAEAAEGETQPALRAVPSEGDEREGGLEALVGGSELTLGFVVAALAMAAALGAVHAFSPGHGKAMVAAYLVGSKGRVRDAVVLGLVVTLTHVTSVLILGLAVLLLTERFLPEDVYPWLGAASGSLVFLIGYWMLAGRALGLGHGHKAHGHAHGHDHDHPHEHADEHRTHHAASSGQRRGPDRAGEDREHGHSHVPEGEVTVWSLLSLGISGGMVPCPSALVVLLAAVAIHRVAFGLVLIAAFSVGLAAVLVLLGVLAVTATRFMGRLTGESRLLKALPVLSAGVVMVVGVSIAVNALVSGGILTAGR